MNLSKSVAVKLTAGLLSAAMMISPALAASGVVTADSGLHVRQSSSADSASLGMLDKGTTVDILSDLGNGWLEISYQASTGYVASDYIEPTTITGKVNAGPLNVRASASTDGAKVGQLPTGTEVEVLSQKDGWYEVVGGNYTGYVSAQYITLDSQSATTTFVKVTNGPLNVRSGPGSSYDKVSSLRTGRVVEVFGQENGWYKIENGYISAEYVCLADASEAVQADLGSEIAQFALTLVGCKYKYGGTGPSAFDCSGFTKYVYKQFGYTLNRTASAQMDNGTSVARSDLQLGDLVMFKKSGSSASRASHVGIYIGNGKFVHASTSSVGVIVSDMNTSYYKTGFVGGRRLV